MTESATRNPWLTRRRAIAGAVLAVLGLAVPELGFGVFDAAKPVKLTFVRFENQLRLPGRAIVTISNRSDTKQISIQFNLADAETA